jgi:hypothetical protein
LRGRRWFNWCYWSRLRCWGCYFGGDDSLALDRFEVIVEEVVVGTASKLVIHDE